MRAATLISRIRHVLAVAFTQRVRLAATVEVSTTSTAAARFDGQGILIKVLALAFFGGWVGDRASQRHQHVVRQAVHEHAKAVGHVAMIAQPIGAQLTLQFLVAVLAFAAFGILVVSTLRKHRRAGTIGYHGATVGTLGIRFALDDNPSRLRPRAGLIP